MTVSARPLGSRLQILVRAEHRCSYLWSSGFGIVDPGEEGCGASFQFNICAGPYWLDYLHRTMGQRLARCTDDAGWRVTPVSRHRMLSASGGVPSGLSPDSANSATEHRWSRFPITAGRRRKLAACNRTAEVRNDSGVVCVPMRIKPCAQLA